jgi:nucleoside-diphosphate-sugar epimerase
MILVTGGTGLLGSHLIIELVNRGEQVRAIYRTEERKNAVLNVFSYYSNTPEAIFDKVDWVEADVLDVPNLEDALEGVSKVYHCAATVSFVKKEREHMDKVNVEGTANLVNLCVERNNVRLCHVSSIAAIGRDGSEEVISETNEWKPSEYNSAYAESKYYAELEVWRGMEEGLGAFIINPSMILGPGNWETSSGNIFLRVWNGLKFYTRGGNCFVDVRDVTKAMVLLMESEIRSERFIIGAENWKYRSIFEKIAEVLERKPPKIEATPFMSQLAWRAEAVLSALTGKRPFITKEVALNAVTVNRYSNSKLLERFPEFQYRSLDETLKFVGEKLREEMATDPA